MIVDTRRSPDVRIFGANFSPVCPKMEVIGRNEIIIIITEKRLLCRSLFVVNAFKKHARSSFRSDGDDVSPDEKKGFL